MTVTSGFYDWNKGITALFEASGNRVVSENMFKVISSRVPIESFIVFQYHKAGIPEILYENLNNMDHRKNLKSYLDGAYLLDPFYQHFAEGDIQGPLRLRDIAPDHFLKSDYYHSYYKFSGLGDEVNIYIPLSGQSAIALALGRKAGRRGFGKKELTMLQDMMPVLNSVCRRQWQNTAAQAAQGNIRFIQALENFGTSYLSVKESEVLHLLLMGHSAKSTAARMGISPGTVKVHRNNIYAKLDIGSQTELFSLFIGALAHMTGDGSEDPLIAYHQ